MHNTEGSISGASFLIALTGLFTAGSVCAGTVGHWSFGGGVPGHAATALPTEVNAPALDAAAAYAGAGAAPAFDADTPCARVWDGVSGGIVNAGNTASLRFVNAGLPANTNSTDGGALTVADNALLRATNLTVEAFVKVGRRVNWPLIAGKRRTDGNGTSWNLDLDNAGRPRVRIDSQPLGSSGGSGGWNQSWTAPVAVEDGKWHHLAFTYSHTDRAVKLYVDHVLRAGGQSFSNLVYDARELRIGQGAGDRAFDGWIDEVRISDEALAPEQFMTPNDPSGTLGHWSFDDGTAGAAAGTLTNQFYAPFLHGAAATSAGGVKPAFSGETPPDTTRRISDGRDGAVVNVANKASLRFVNKGLPDDPASKAGGQVVVPGTLLPAQPTNFTAEAFVKVDRRVTYPQIIGKSRLATGGLSWSLALNASGNLRARFDTQTPPATDGFNQTFESAAKVDDGNWHHAALTYDAPTRSVRLYLDYVEVKTGVTAAPVCNDGGNILIGNGDKAFDGWIDEVRLTGRVLEPDEFLRTVPDVGVVTGVQ
jgi:hypothetical protein